MKCVVDANIVKAYFEESVHGTDYGLTETSTALFEDNILTTIYHDSKGQIEHEWEQNVEPEWFRAFLIKIIEEQIVEEIDHQVDQSLLRRLLILGWNRGKKDFVYVWTALAATNAEDSSISLISEDLDFYNPKQKGIARGNKRLQILRGKTNPVQKCCKRFRIQILCVEAAIGLN